MEQLKYSNVFDAITEDPVETADLKFRADLMLLLREYFRAQDATPADICQRLGVPQPRVSELLNGKTFVPPELVPSGKRTTRTP